MDKITGKGKFIFGKDNDPIECECISIEELGLVFGLRDTSVIVKFLDKKNIDLANMMGRKGFLEIQFELPDGIKTFQWEESMCNNIVPQLKCKDGKYYIDREEYAELYFLIFHEDRFKES
jgi:hypothetical protein